MFNELQRYIHNQWSYSFGSDTGHPSVISSMQLGKNQLCCLKKSADPPPAPTLV